MVKYCRNNAAVRVIPASETGAVTRIESILEDCLVLIKGIPFAGGGVVKRDEETTGRNLDLI